MVFYHCHFAFSSIHQLSPNKFNEGIHLILELGILLPVDVFAHFYIGLLFTSVQREMNLFI